jgi:putative glutamine amidotransferase
VTGARPVIGITCYVEPARWGVWDKRAALLPWSYVDKLQAAGGRVVLLPPDDLDADVLDRLDGLLLAGGADVDPERYGAPAHELTVSRPERDAGELTVLRGALERDMPVLGVCRGMQMLAVAYGGTLHQHLPEVVGHSGHQSVPGVFTPQAVRTEPGSRLDDILGPAQHVPCYHHQGVRDLVGLTVSARADDGVIEGVEDPARRFVLGVQWHPEEGDDPRLFDALVAAARAATVPHHAPPRPRPH